MDFIRRGDGLRLHERRVVGQFVSRCRRQGFHALVCVALAAAAQVEEEGAEGDGDAGDAACYTADDGAGGC